MAIDFTLSPEQKKVQMDARDFAENVLAPVVRDADAEPDPLKAFQKTKRRTSRHTSEESPSACSRSSMAGAA